jgi:hypothetical protein
MSDQTKNLLLLGIGAVAVYLLFTQNSFFNPVNNSSGGSNSGLPNVPFTLA